MSLREWWMSPPRTGLRRFVSPLVYRYPRPLGWIRLASVPVAAAAAIACLWVGAVGWAAFFFAVAAVSLVVGYWLLTKAG